MNNNTEKNITPVSDINVLVEEAEAKNLGPVVQKADFQGIPEDAEEDRDRTEAEAKALRAKEIEEKLNEAMKNKLDRLFKNLPFNITEIYSEYQRTTLDILYKKEMMSLELQRLNPEDELVPLFVGAINNLNGKLEAYQKKTTAIEELMFDIIRTDFNNIKEGK